MVNSFYDNLPPVAHFIEKYNLKALKSLGQNFILDLNLTDKIAKSVPFLSDSVVVEVGSGPAGLSRALLKNNVQKLIAIEYDKRAINILHDLQAIYKNRLIIIEDDALNVDFNLLKNLYAPSSPFRICSNLPYNISIPLLIKWIHSSNIIDSMTLMFQLEVGKRITASPHSKDFGRISIISQLNFQTKILFQVSRNSFVPPPKITSCIVQFNRLDSFLSSSDLKKTEMVVKYAFSQKRKMLRTTLKPLFHDDISLKSSLNSIGISETDRAEDLSPQDFFNLAMLIQ